jgi:hypothetical protein
MAIIATYSEGHEQHGQIIDWAREPWPAIKQYENPELSFVLFDLADDEEPVSIEEFGPVSPHVFKFGDVSVDCSSVYHSANVATQKVEA